MSSLIKTTLCVSVIATTASLAHAKMPMFHIGAGVGYSSAKTIFKRNLNIPNTKNESKSIKTDGTLGQLNIGADYFADNGIYTGLQLSGFLSDISGSKQLKTPLVLGGRQALLANKNSIKMKKGFQLDARLGKKVCNFVPHLIVGMAVANWKATSTYAVQNTTVNRKFSHSKNCPGMVVGAGVDYNLTERFFVRAEYQYTWYKKLTIHETNQNRSVTTFKPRTSLAMISAGWRFG